MKIGYAVMLLLFLGIPLWLAIKFPMDDHDWDAKVAFSKGIEPVKFPNYSLQKSTIRNVERIENRVKVKLDNGEEYILYAYGAALSDNLENCFRSGNTIIAKYNKQTLCIYEVEVVK